jgi:PhoH-like ATPase
VIELKQYKKIVVVRGRDRDFMDDDPGFLLGDLKEKSMPLLAGGYRCFNFYACT